MKRLLLAILLLTLATLMIPPLRQRAEPHIETGRLWLGEKLEGPMTPVLTPYRRMKTEARLGAAAQILIRQRNRGQQPPAPTEFGQFMSRHDLSPTDEWGVPLRMNQEPDSVAMISAGPDLEFGSEDDIVHKVRFAAPPDRLWRRR